MSDNKLNKQSTALLAIAEKAASLETTIKQEGESISNQVLKIAKECKTVDEFLADCDSAELAFKYKHNTKKMPRAYTKPKSIIKQGWMAGVEPSKYTTESAYRKKVDEVKGTNTSGRNKETGSPKGMNVVSKDTGVTGHEKLNEALQLIIGELKIIETKTGPEHMQEAVARAEVVLLTAKSELTDIIDEFVEIVGGTVEKTSDKESNKSEAA